jgi:sigma-B regulation protein RsbU (phosphoserine phosphatase)
MSLISLPTSRPGGRSSVADLTPSNPMGSHAAPGLWSGFPLSEPQQSPGWGHEEWRQIQPMLSAARALGRGEGDPFVVVDGEDEMSLLARAFNRMAAQIRAREERLRAALRREQRIASTLQQAFLPQSLPDCPGYSLAAAYHPAMQEAEVGGDFYDAFPLPDGRFGLLLGDVAGKGLAAANTATMTRYTTRAYALQSAAPGVVLGHVNDALCESIDDPGLFVTAFYGVLEPVSGVFRYAVAGHWPALVARRQGVETVGGRSLTLAIAAGAVYNEEQIDLESGDGMLLYTDGLVEIGTGDPMEQLAAVRQSLDNMRSTSPAEWLDELCCAARQKSGGRLRDDVTLMALRRG